jgi:hypothetical protein
MRFATSEKLMTTDTFLFNAGWLFFAAFLVVIAAVTITAFGRDLLSWTSHPDPAYKSPTDRARPTQPTAR